MFDSDEKKERLKKILDSFPTPVKVRNSKKVSYAWVVNVEFERISKFLRQGATFERLFEYFASHDMLPENGDCEKLRQAYRREEKRRRQAEGEGSKADNNTKKTAIPPATPTPHAATTAIKTPPTPPLPISPIGEPKLTRKILDEETDEERVARVRKQVHGTFVDTGTSRIIKHADGSFDILD